MGKPPETAHYTPGNTGMWELWVSEFVPGLGQSVKIGGKLQASDQGLFIFKMMTTFHVWGVLHLVLKSCGEPPYFQYNFFVNILPYILEDLHPWKYWSLVFLIF